MTWKRAPMQSARRKKISQREHADKEHAAHYLTRSYPVARDTWTANELFNYLRRDTPFEYSNYVYVINASRKLVGVISLKSVLAHPDLPVKKLMRSEIITISPDTRIERVAKLALEHNLRAIPVVKDQILLGVIETQKILSIINRALRENLLSAGGLPAAHLDYDDTMQVPLGKSVLHRLPWLVIGLFGVIIAAAIINQFESVLNQHLILAFFIPAIVYMADALGTQNQTLLIRDLAVLGNELKLGPYIIKTTIIATIMSILIGVLVYLMTTLIWGETRTAFVIAIAMFATLMISSLSSLFTTLIFRKLHQDPALGSGPFATIISDVTAIIVYFLIVSVLLT